VEIDLNFKLVEKDYHKLTLKALYVCRINGNREMLWAWDTMS